MDSRRFRVLMNILWAATSLAALALFATDHCFEFAFCAIAAAGRFDVGRWALSECLK